MSDPNADEKCPKDPRSDPNVDEEGEIQKNDGFILEYKVCY